jgi:hypothetical protein
MGRLFPHPLTGGLKEPGKKYYQALYTSPFGNELLLELVKRAIDAEALGTGGAPDLLCVSFSANDAVGHSWGPDSQEVLDVTLRADRILNELLAHLDNRVGPGRYVLAVTADHGVCPLPELSRARGKEALRLSPALLSRNAADFLDETYGEGDGKGRWLETLEDARACPWLYLNQRLLQARGLRPADVEDALAGWLRKQPSLQSVYTRTRLLQGLPADDAVGQAVLRSYHPDRCGDVVFVMKPYHVYWHWLTGTTHGTPHSYDKHVPLLVYGPGICAGVRQEAVTPQATTAILAHLLGIKPPSGAEAPVPEGLKTD